MLSLLMAPIFDRKTRVQFRIFGPDNLLDTHIQLWVDFFLSATILPRLGRSEFSAHQMQLCLCNYEWEEKLV